MNSRNIIKGTLFSKLMAGLSLGSALVLTTGCGKMGGKYGMTNEENTESFSQNTGNRNTGNREKSIPAIDIKSILESVLEGKTKMSVLESALKSILEKQDNLSIECTSNIVKGLKEETDLEKSANFKEITKFSDLAEYADQLVVVKDPQNRFCTEGSIIVMCELRKCRKIMDMVKYIPVDDNSSNITCIDSPSGISAYEGMQVKLASPSEFKDLWDKCQNGTVKKSGSSKEDSIQSMEMYEIRSCLLLAEQCKQYQALSNMQNRFNKTLELSAYNI